MFDDVGVVCLLTETKPPGLFEHSLFDGLSFLKLHFPIMYMYTSYTFMHLADYQIVYFIGILKHYWYLNMTGMCKMPCFLDAN